MGRASLAGRVVVITGSAGGQATAVVRKLREGGALVALLDIDQTAVNHQAKDLGGPDVARGGQADVRTYADIDSVMREAVQHFGAIDVVLANAGVDYVAPMSLIAKALGLFPSASERLGFRRPTLVGKMPVAPGCLFLHGWLGHRYTAQADAAVRRIFVRKYLFGDLWGLSTSQTARKDENLTMADSSG